MKQFAILPFFLMLLQSLAAQSASPSSANQDVARDATDALVKKYNLNADQSKQMYQIQQRKQRNLADIQADKTSNSALYGAKLQAIQKGTLNSIRGVLNNKAQVDLYNKTQAEVRRKKADKRKELMVKKSSKAEIDAAMLEIYAE
ncbi:MAG: hypothetical protein KGS48_00995 [Bacteroidetes bacterium]|nr:hypothetical protein [Bacteroidota bacterium]